MGDPGGERQTLEQLRSDEDALEREVLAARADANALRDRAHRDAAAIAAEGLREAERAVERLRKAAAEEADRAVAEAQASARAEVEELARRAARNLDRATARAVTAVLGGGEGGP